MKILLTGASGFLGSFILEELKNHHVVETLGRTSLDNHRFDITHSIKPLDQYDMVIHCAGKAHRIPKTETEKKMFHMVNAEGTQNVLNALRGNPPDTFVLISTVAVYGKDAGEMIREEEDLNPDTPYGKSKWIAEQKVLQFGKEQECYTVILRLPLIVGVDAPGNLGAMRKAIRNGLYFRLGQGKSRRSMVLATDVARFIPSLHHHRGIYHLTDGYHPRFEELENQIALHDHKKIKSLPHSFLKLVARIGDHLPGFPLNTYRLKKLTSTLTFSDEKARRELGWKSQPVIENNSWLDES